jgi:hypothetical protein
MAINPFPDLGPDNRALSCPTARGRHGLSLDLLGFAVSDTERVGPRAALPSPAHTRLIEVALWPGHLSLSRVGRGCHGSRPGVCSTLVSGPQSDPPKLARYGVVWPEAACLLPGREQEKPMSVQLTACRRVTSHDRHLRGRQATVPAPDGRSAPDG